MTNSILRHPPRKSSAPWAEACRLSLISLLLCSAGLAALLVYGPRWIAVGSMGGPPAAEARRLLTAAERRWPDAMTLTNGAPNHGAIAATKSLLAQSLALNPDDPAAHSRLAGLLEREGDLPASAAVERAHSAVLLAASAEGAGREKSAAFALDLARRALDAAPGPETDRILFDAALIAGNPTLALESLNRLAPHMKENAAEGLWLQSRLARAAHLPVDEKRLALASLAAEPGRRDAALAIAQLAQDSSDRQKAIAALQAALGKHADDADLWRALGQALFLEADLRAAESALENAIRFDPLDSGSMELLARVLEQSGGFSRASRLRKAAAELQEINAFR